MDIGIWLFALGVGGALVYLCLHPEKVHAPVSLRSACNAFTGGMLLLVVSACANLAVLFGRDAMGWGIVFLAISGIFLFFTLQYLFRAMLPPRREK